jgi:hypothetical protein
MIAIESIIADPHILTIEPRSPDWSAIKNAALLYVCDTLTAQSKLRMKVSRCVAQPGKRAWSCGPQASFAHGYRQYRDILQ